MLINSGTYGVTLLRLTLLNKIRAEAHKAMANGYKNQVGKYLIGERA